MESCACAFLSDGRLTIVTCREFRTSGFFWNAMMFQKRHHSCDLWPSLPASWYPNKVQEQILIQGLEAIPSCPSLAGMLSPSGSQARWCWCMCTVTERLIWESDPCCTLLGFGFGLFSCSKVMNIEVSFRGIYREDTSGVREYFKPYDFCSFFCDVILVCAFKFYNKQTYWWE